jgi:hypothetical protein
MPKRKKQEMPLEVVEAEEEIQPVEQDIEMVDDALVYEEEAEEPKGDDPLFEGGPTNDMVAEWKSRWGAIYATEFDDEVFIWRTLSRIEYKEILKVKNADGLYREERICEKCVLWPEGYGFMNMGGGKAGQPSIVAEQIMAKSGFAASEATRL